MRRKSTYSYANGNCLALEDGWRKASHSIGNANCAEVSAWRKASHSGYNGNCAEVAAWRKASASNGHECVEVAVIPAVAVRDTKNNETGPVLTFTRGQWLVFTSQVKTLS